MQVVKSNITQIESGIKNLDCIYDSKNIIKIPQLIKDIINYSCIGGKYIRGCLILDSCPKEINLAVAIELIHSASLIIDDLPCMDNDLIRRGKASTFKQYGEKNTLMTAFLMVNYGYYLIVNEFKEYDIKYLNRFFECIMNLITGQIYDINNENNENTENKDNKDLYLYKTTSIFQLIFCIIFLKKNIEILDEDFINDTKKLGDNLGYMYQISDDMIDYNIDIVNANYIKRNGVVNSKKEFIKCQKEFVNIYEKRIGKKSFFIKNLINKLKKQLNQ